MWVGCNKSLHQSVLCIRQFVLLAVNALAVLTSTLVESAEHNHHISLTSLADSLVDEFILRTAVAKFVIAYGDSVETLDGVAHIATGIVHNTESSCFSSGREAADSCLFPCERMP